VVTASQGPACVPPLIGVCVAAAEKRRCGGVRPGAGCSRRRRFEEELLPAAKVRSFVGLAHASAEDCGDGEASSVRCAVGVARVVRCDCASKCCTRQRPLFQSSQPQARSPTRCALPWLRREGAAGHPISGAGACRRQCEVAWAAQAATAASACCSTHVPEGVRSWAVLSRTWRLPEWDTCCSNALAIGGRRCFQMPNDVLRVPACGKCDFTVNPIGGAAAGFRVAAMSGGRQRNVVQSCLAGGATTRCTRGCACTRLLRCQWCGWRRELGGAGVCTRGGAPRCWMRGRDGRRLQPLVAASVRVPSRVGVRRGGAGRPRLRRRGSRSRGHEFAVVGCSSVAMVSVQVSRRIPAGVTRRVLPGGAPWGACRPDSCRCASRDDSCKRVRFIT